MTNRRQFLKSSLQTTIASSALSPWFVQAALANDSDSTRPIAQTNLGKVRGAFANGVYSFKGIHYGASTEGPMRFQPPSPPKPWSGIRDALQLGLPAPTPPLESSLTIGAGRDQCRKTASSLTSGRRVCTERSAKYDDALKSTNDALTLFRDLGDEANQALCLNNLGSIRSYMGNPQDALTYYQQPYQIWEKLKLTDEMAESLHNLAETNVELGQYNTAVTQYLKALEIRRNRPLSHAKSGNWIALVVRDQRDERSPRNLPPVI